MITPVLWRGTRLIRLPGGPGQAVAVNERGQVLGAVRRADTGAVRAVLRTR